VGRFAGTVAVNRKCYYAWNVNYALFGRMFKSIYDDGVRNRILRQRVGFSLSKAKVCVRGSKLFGTGAVRGENVAQALVLTEYGFSGTLPTPGLLCIPTGEVTESTFEWKWSPNHEP